MSTLAQRPVLSDLFWKAEGNHIWVKRFALLVAGVAALWISAKIQIASVPVPVTLQMLVIMVIGASYGPRLAASTVAASGARREAGTAGDCAHRRAPCREGRSRRR